MNIPGSRSMKGAKMYSFVPLPLQGTKILNISTSMALTHAESSTLTTLMLLVPESRTWNRWSTHSGGFKT